MKQKTAKQRIQRSLVVVAFSEFCFNAFSMLSFVLFEWESRHKNEQKWSCELRKRTAGTCPCSSISLGFSVIPTRILYLEYSSRISNVDNTSKLRWNFPPARLQKIFHNSLSIKNLSHYSTSQASSSRETPRRCQETAILLSKFTKL